MRVVGLQLVLHVPWTSLTSQPVEITLNTIEIVASTISSGEDASDAKHSKAVNAGKPQSEKSSTKNVGATSTPVSDSRDSNIPSYLEGIISRIMHNVRIRINNVILKYEEVDTVLSVNLKSVELFATNGQWVQSFVHVSPPQYLLHRCCKLTDLTVCLDKKDASTQKIHYQAPLLDRCSLTLRFRLSYPGSINLTPLVSIIHVRIHGVPCECWVTLLVCTVFPMWVRDFS